MDCENEILDESNEEQDRPSVCMASSAMQQLPKILDALSNMARRSRIQLERKGKFLGGTWPETGSVKMFNDSKHLPVIKNIPDDIIPGKKGGILKTSKYTNLPTIAQISSLNEFWKTFAFTFSNESQFRQMRTSRQTGFPPDYGKMHYQNLQGALYSPQINHFLQSTALSLSHLPILQRIFLDYMKCSYLRPEEEEILVQLQHLRVLFNIPVHKLLRERPKEFVVPLPRRSKRSLLCSSNPHTRSLVFHQTVRFLPEATDENNNSWLCRKVKLFNQLSPSTSRSCLSKWNRGRFYCARTMPKGVAFLTYPDTSGDETSFEGTIGERSIISWKKGTRFPQMGIDQSLDFRCKKELSRQSMIQSRLCAARIQRRMSFKYKHQYMRDGDLRSCQARRSFVHMPKSVVRRRSFHPKRIKGTATGHPIFRSWYKFVKSPKPNGTNRKKEKSRSPSQLTSTQSEGSVRFPSVDDSTARLEDRRKSAKRVERRKRLRIYLMKVFGFLSCGVLPYIMTGECYVFKRKKRIRLADLTERVQSPKDNEVSVNPQVPTPS